MSEDSILVMTIKADTKYLIVTGRDGAVTDHTDLADQGKPIINYDRHHLRSYEGSMSACIHNIYFQPKTHRIKFSDLCKYVDIPFPILRASCVAGSFWGIPLNEAGVEELRSTGHKIPLMSDTLVNGKEKKHG